MKKILGALSFITLATLAACGSAGDDLHPDASSGASSSASISAAELDISAKAAAGAALSKWTAPITLPIVPVSAANQPDGKILLWSAENRFSFSSGSQTYSVLFDPSTSTYTQKLVTQTSHDMFCVGTANLPDGRVLVSGGISAEKSSVYNPATNSWSAGGNMKIPRAYHATTLLQDGRVFALGGSWAGPTAKRNGEIWTDGVGWSLVPGVPVDSFLSPETSRPVFAPDSHFWLLPSGNGKVLYAGPGVNLQWIDTTGNGKVSLIGPRGDDEFSINGNAVMYDIGKILKVGGARNYTDTDANANANSFIIDVTGVPKVRRIGSMNYRRTYHNSVVLPNGQVVIMGGQTFGKGFADSDSVLVSELFDPATETFTLLPAMSVPRNYHSIALLLPDGRVMSAGGGLCGDGCAANHPDMQILSPGYLFNADGSAATRPVISAAPASAGYGSSATVTTDSAVTAFALVRLASNTHTVNNDQRRIPLQFDSNGGNSYTLRMPSNPGWALPGNYMLFAMNANGVPSVSKILNLSVSRAPRLPVIDDQGAAVGGNFSFTVAGSHPDGAQLRYAATGLPPGLQINPSTGLISGTPTTSGAYPVVLSASDNSQTISTNTAINVTDTGTVRYVRLEQVSEINGYAWGSMAEFNLLDERGNTLSRGAWTVSADSADTASGGVAQLAVDGNPATFWHTQYNGAVPRPPLWFQIDLGGTYRIGGFKYLPRQDTSPNGTIALYRFWVSSDGINWGTPVSQGNLAPLATGNGERVVSFNNLALGKAAQQASTATNGAAARAVDGNPDGAFNNNSVTSTSGGANDWWEVDLGAMYAINSVRLWNRTDCCAERLTNFQVFVSPTSMVGRTYAALIADTSLARVTVPAGVAGNLLVPFSGAGGRYVRVQLAGQNILSLAEVEVFGTTFVNRAPILNTPASQRVTVGATANLQMVASDPDGSALSYAASGLPGGLTINGATGLISGATNTTGVFSPTVTVTDAGGQSASASFTWSVEGGVPQIAPITTMVVGTGAAATYAVSATGNGQLTYQWDYGDGTPVAAFGNSPSATHTYAASGVYMVTVTVMAADGATSTRSFLQAVTLPTVAGSPVASSNLIIEPRSGASARVWAVNPDNDSVSVIDTATNSRVAEINVGSAPRSLARDASGRIWVVNKVSGTLSIISPSTLAVTQTVTLARGSSPFGIVFGTDGNAYVTLEALGQLVRINTGGAVQATLNLGGSPRHLARSADGTRLLVSNFITAPQPGEGTLTVSATLNGVGQGGTVTHVVPASMAVSRVYTLQHSDKADNTLQARGVPNYLGAAAFSPDGKSAWIPSKQDNIARGMARSGQDLTFESSVRAIVSRIDLAANAEDYPARIDHDNSGLASAALFHPTGAYLFVALQSSRNIAVVDPGTRRELFRFEAGLAPEGLAISPDGLTLYVHNFMSRSVGVYDLTQLIRFGQMTITPVKTVGTITTEKLAAGTLLGKQLFYDGRDPRLTRDSYLSCASCHNDGGHDGRTWDITGFGEGLRNTVSLRGRGGMGQGFAHWSANFDEVQDFEGQIRRWAGGTGLMTAAQFAAGTRSLPLGDKKAGINADLDALAAYVGSLSAFPISPFRNADGSLTTAAVAGKTVFTAKGCGTCHAGAGFTASTNATGLKNVGTIKASSGKRLDGALTGIDVPTLRDVWATAPYLHDGSALTLADAVKAHNTATLTATELTNVVEYLRQIGSEETPPVIPLPSGTTQCATENGTCTVPVGKTAEVYYGTKTSYFVRFGVTGALGCNNTVFGDPAYGFGKVCTYVVRN